MEGKAAWSLIARNSLGIMQKLLMAIDQKEMFDWATETLNYQYQYNPGSN
jgi:hypothetical protein